MDVSRCVSFWASFAGVCAKSVTIGHSVKVHHQLLSQFHLHKYCKTDDMYLINIVYMYIYIYIYVYLVINVAIFHHISM